MPAEKIWFEPSEYSVEEIRFLLVELEQPPVIMREIPLPPRVVRAQVLKLVTQCYELEEKQTHSKIPWVGYDRVREQLERTLSWYQTCQELARRGGPTHASMQTWDGNRFMPSGVESDSGIVRTEILPNGRRRPLGLNLASPDGQSVGPNLIGAAPWLSPDGSFSQDLLSSTPMELVYAENAEAQTGSVTCPVCEWSESYSLAQSSGKRLAHGRMISHLKRAKTQKDRHAILHSRITGKSVAA